MSFANTYSADELRYRSTQIKREKIVQFIEYNITPNVLNAAAKEETSYFWQRPAVRNAHIVHPTQPVWEATNEELVIALKQKFPGTKVEAQETWVEVSPGVKNLQKGILIDWS